MMEYFFKGIFIGVKFGIPIGVVGALTIALIDCGKSVTNNSTEKITSTQTSVLSTEVKA